MYKRSLLGFPVGVVKRIGTANGKELASRLWQLLGMLIVQRGAKVGGRL
jgi:hypothetical protein